MYNINIAICNEFNRLYCDIKGIYCLFYVFFILKSSFMR